MSNAEVPKKVSPPSTRGRGKTLAAVSGDTRPVETEMLNIRCADSLQCYRDWDAPVVIVSDGAYGVLGFDGDTSDHTRIAEWYQPHIEQWSTYATPQTTLWFWNSEVGWATVHPLLERHGWVYQNCNVWNKGLAHIAGNINTEKIRRFPVVSEVCVQYAFRATMNSMTLKEWLLHEWKRSGLMMKQANFACGVKDAAVRKYLDQGHLWYFPPTEMFARLRDFANTHGDKAGRPYFANPDGSLVSNNQWDKMRPQFNCPHGVTNVWSRPPLKGSERLKAPSGKRAHLNQKPLDLMTMLILASSSPSDVVWEPFGGLFSASVASLSQGRRAFAAEIDADYYKLGKARFRTLLCPSQHDLFSDGVSRPAKRTGNRLESVLLKVS